MTKSAIWRRSSSWVSPIRDKALSLTSIMYSLPSLATTTSKAQISRPPNSSLTCMKTHEFTKAPTRITITNHRTNLIDPCFVAIGHRQLLQHGGALISLPVSRDGLAPENIELQKRFIKRVCFYRDILNSGQCTFSRIKQTLYASRVQYIMQPRELAWNCDCVMQLNHFAYVMQVWAKWTTFQDRWLKSPEKDSIYRENVCVSNVYFEA